MDRSLIDKIVALKAKAQDRAVTEKEAELFAAKAAELMRKHAIEEADLTDRPDHGLDQRKIKYMNPWRRDLLESIGAACYCEVLFGQGEDLYVVGRPLNVEAFYEMFYFIERQVVLIARELFPGDRKAQVRAEGGLGMGVARKIQQSNLMDRDRYLPVVQEAEAAEAAAQAMLNYEKVKTRGHRATREHIIGEMHSDRVQIRQETE